MRVSPNKCKSPISFYKFIRPGLNCQMSIPISFQKYLKSRRNNESAILKRGSKKWHVKIDEDWVFGEGWERFVSENGVQDFDFLVFKHEGNMVFDTMVFDTSSCEREYPIDQLTILKAKKVCPEARNDDLSEEPVESREMVETEALNCHCHFHVPKAFALANGLTAGEIILKYAEKEGTWAVNLEMNNKRKSYYVRCGLHEFCIANGLKAGNNIKFELVRDGGKPVAVISSILAEEETRKKKAAQIACSKSIATAYSIKKSVVIDKDWVFGEGWETFVRDNGVQEFDFVVFKHEGNMVFDTMVFDTSSCEREYPIHKAMTMKTKKACLEEKSFGKRKTDIDVLKKTPKVKDTYINKSTKSLKSEKTMTPDHSNYPYFIGTLKAPGKNLFLPVSFTKSNGLRTGEMILRNGQTELSWIVDLKIYRGNYYFIGRGWPAFYIENGLKRGDRFKLEFVQTEIDSMANFYRLSEETREKKENRYFKSIVTASKCSSGFCKRSNGFVNMNNSEMVVMDKKQRLWPTIVYPIRDRVRIRGFKDIFAANGLKAEDEFVLELVDNGKKPLMNLKCNLFLPTSLSICCLKHATVSQIFISDISIIMPCNQ
ncbi:B3 DNA binding domain-containing protein [Artemisia annua]|uniref:B3 DNA binding domain-containing protein n=1 Tax=Artemisia annua TaxID=35608 RepID=A0A2U1PAE7_ARTAN|nr:B3 DNA binding domain-containing protein [Artemisia annua]